VLPPCWCSTWRVICGEGGELGQAALEGLPDGDGGGDVQPIVPRSGGSLLGMWEGSGGRLRAGIGTLRRRGATKPQVEHGGDGDAVEGRGATDRGSSDRAKAPGRSLQQNK
jgi:hypothetical protein